MAEILINLLPGESVSLQKRQAKFYLIGVISTTALLLLIFLASLAVALRILQSQNINKVKFHAGVAEEKVSAQKSKETTLVVLKNRLTIISQIARSPSKHTAIYNLVTAALPPSVSVTYISVDRAGHITISVVAPDSSTLDNLLINLTSQTVFDQIQRIEIESLSRGKDGIYRASFKLIAKS